MNTLRRVLHFFLPDKLRMAGAFGLMLVTTGLSILKPWPLAWIVDSVLGDQPLPTVLATLGEGWSDSLWLAVLSVLILFIHGAQGAMASLQNLVVIQIGLNGLARVRQELFEHLQRLSMRFFQWMPQGDLIYRATWDTYAFQTLFQQGIFTMVTSLFLLCSMIVVMGIVNWQLTLVTLVTVPVVVICMKFFGARMRRHSQAAHKADGQATSRVQQAISHLNLVQACGRERDETLHYGQLVSTALARRNRQHRTEVLYLAVVACLFGAGTAAIAWFGGTMVLANDLSLGTLIVFVSYLHQLYEPLNQLSHVGSTVSDAGAGVDRVYEILEKAPEVRDARDARPVVAFHGKRSRDGNSNVLEVRGRIEFQNVTFRYQPDRPVLEEIRFQCEPGERIGISGPSGSGKTTLLGLMLRFYDPNEGFVLLDGEDLRRLKVREMRQQFAWVPQEPILLPATVAENIRYAKPAATDEEVVWAAEQAFADRFIHRLPERFNTVVGEGSTRLSVGEKQRISMARAFLQNAPILLLDEPTSALDRESEDQVMAAIHQLSEGRTTFLVVHREELLQRVERVLVLVNGKLQQEGTHKGL